jgi:hypothetical protein
MAHSGCACHASLPRHRFHSILPPAPEIHNSQHKSRNARTVVQDPVASNPAVDLPASSRLSHAAHEYHHGCRHWVEKIQISEPPEKFLTIIPAELDEACFQVLAPQLGESLTERMRAILCSTGNAPLYCTPARNGGTVYWIAQTFSPVSLRFFQLWLAEVPEKEPPLSLIPAPVWIILEVDRQKEGRTFF